MTISQSWALYLLMGIHEENSAMPPTKSSLRLAAETYKAGGKTFGQSLGQAARDLVDESILDSDLSALAGFDGTSLRAGLNLGATYTGTPPCPAPPAVARLYNRIAQAQ
jgi:hypothetical protein